MVSETSHERLRELLASYALGALDDDEAQEVADHLSGCLACRRELRQLRRAVDLLSSGEQMPVEAKARIWDRIRRRVARPRRRPLLEPVNDEPDEDSDT